MIARYQIKSRDHGKWIGKSQHGYALTRYKEQARTFDLSTANMLIDKLEASLKTKLKLVPK